MVAAVLAGGLATAGASAASGTGSTSDNTGLLNGNQINLPIQIPVDVCGNAVGVLGTANAGCEGGAKATNKGSGGGNTSSGNLGAANGNQINAPIQVPVSACGNAVGGLAVSASCKGGAKAANYGSGGSNTTSGNTGLLNGNQINLPVQVPISVCGNAVAVLGTSQAWCVGGAKASNPGGKGGKGSYNSTSGNLGALSGNQITAPIQVPVSVCGNAAAVLGAASASCQGGVKAYPPGGSCPDQVTSGNALLGNGNQICAPIQVPINVCGNAVGVAGSAEASCSAPAVPSPPVKKPTPPSLPTTGFSVGLPLGLAAMLLIGGSVAVYLGRRRQSRHKSA
jgi:hypothetical protein